jgi:hypothetical protein
MASPSIAGRAYAVIVTESNLQHDRPKAAFLYFVIARYPKMGIASDNASSQK